MSSRSFSEPDELFDIHTVTQSGKPCNTVLDFYFQRLQSRRRGEYAGIRTPDYHKVVAEGGVLPLNGYRRWDYEIVANPGTRTWNRIDTSSGCEIGQNSPYTYIAPADLFDESGSGLDLPSTSHVNWDALTLAAIASVLPSLDALTTYMESRQTVKMIVDARRDAKRLIRDALRGGKHTAKAAADAWMAWRYGWQILGLDIKNAYELIKEPCSSLIVTGQSGENFTSDIGYSPTQSWTDGITGRFQRSAIGQWNVSCRARAVVVWKYSTLNVVVDPWITAWELVPFSFVADWFVNVGDVLSAWNVRRNAANIQVSQGLKAEAIRQTYESAEALPGWNHSGSWGWTETAQYKSRWPASVPSLVPSIDVNLTSPRIIDAGAMLSKRIF
jgi:hypothetical protein